MSIKAHRQKKASFKAFSFAAYKGWSVFVAKGAAVRLRPSRWNKMAKTGLGLKGHKKFKILDTCNELLCFCGF